MGTLTLDRLVEIEQGIRLSPARSFVLLIPPPTLDEMVEVLRLARTALAAARRAERLKAAAQAFLEAAALESMTKAPGYIKAKRRLRAALAQQREA